MSLRLALLGMLASGERSGYDLLREFDDVLSHVWQASQPQIYQELRRLAEQGFTAAGPPEARGRTPYRLTAEGKTELRRLMGDTDPDHGQRNETLLRAFFLWTVEPAVALRQLHAEQEHCDQRLTHLRALISEMPDGTRADRSAQLAAQAGIHRLEALRQWLTQACEQVQEWEREDHAAPES